MLEIFQLTIDIFVLCGMKLLFKTELIIRYGIIFVTPLHNSVVYNSYKQFSKMTH